MKRHSRNIIGVLRRQKHWRQLDLAKRLGCYQSEVSAFERGAREPGVHLAERIARVLGKKVEEVF